MIHKFTSNDNKGNVNIVEVGSTYTKLGRVAPPVEDTDAANKAYVDSVAGGSGGVLIVHATYEEWEDNGTWKWKETLDKTATELASADFVVLSNRPVPLETGSWGQAYLCYITVPSEYDLTQEWWFAFTNTYKDGDDVKVGWTEFVSSSADGYPFAEGVIE